MGFKKDIENILSSYSSSFTNKVYSDENNDTDIIMELFGVSPELKRENRQYWGRELGMVWQRIVVSIFKHHHSEYGPALKFDSDEPCDLTVGRDAIDTKYRIGSGDSGTLKKFKQYGVFLREQGYEPIFLIVREDNLPAAITACHVGTWRVLTGEDSFNYIKEKTGVDIKELLLSYKGQFKINRI